MANSYGTVTVTTSATEIRPANTSRKGIFIQNKGNVPIYLGFDDQVTTSNGFEVLPRGGQAWEGLEVSWRGVVYGIAGSGSQDVRFMEWEY